MAEICYNTDCPYNEWYKCKRTCTCITQLADGYWYHGNGKIGGEFHPNKPNDEEHYGEYVKIVRCKDCVYWRYDDCQNDNHGYCPTNENDFCPWGERKYEVERMKIDMTDKQLETAITQAYNEGYKRGYQDGVQHIKNVVKELDGGEE